MYRLVFIVKVLQKRKDNRFIPHHKYIVGIILSVYVLILLTQNYTPT